MYTTSEDFKTIIDNPSRKFECKVICGSKTYTNIKERTIELKDKVLNSYKEKVGEEAYNELVKTINDDLERYKESVAPVEEKIGEAYQNTKNKLDTWYQKFKESSD